MQPVTPDEIETIREIESKVEERRTVPLSDVDIQEDSGAIRFVGYAATFDTESHNLGGFTEVIRRGAFRSALKADQGDIFFFGLEHNQHQPLARTSIRSGPGRLELREDAKGLRTEAHLVNTSVARDLQELVSAEVVTEMSYGFRMREPGETRILGRQSVERREDGGILRTIDSFYRLLDVTTAVGPAYPGTSASMRSLACGREIVDELGEVQQDILDELAWMIHRGDEEASVEERAAIDAAFARIDTVSPWIAERALRAASLSPELRAAVPGKRATVELVDAESGETLNVVAFRLAARKRRLRALGVTTSDREKVT
jgi:HK97 family phage prohead protease